MSASPRLLIPASYPTTYRPKRDEELRPIGTRTAVRHGHGPLILVPQARHELVLELGAVDAGAATAGTGRVTALDHEARDDAVEDDVVVLAGAGELGKVLAGLIVTVVSCCLAVGNEVKSECLPSGSGPCTAQW